MQSLMSLISKLSKKRRSLTTCNRWLKIYPSNLKPIMSWHKANIILRKKQTQMKLLIIKSLNKKFLFRKNKTIGKWKWMIMNITKGLIIKRTWAGNKTIRRTLSFIRGISHIPTPTKILKKYSLGLKKRRKIKPKTTMKP